MQHTMQGATRSATRRHGVTQAHTSALLAALLCLCLVGCNPVPPALRGLGAPASAPAHHVARPGPPARIRIPAIGLDWPVVPVGRDATGAMDAPQGDANAASWHEGFWWKYGYLIGQPGNAVIAGHVDDLSGDLTPFAQISQLHPGDVIAVTTTQGDTFRYTVTRVQALPNPVGGPSDPTITALFGPAPMPQLNLITCAGDWVGNEFDQRLVVYATLAA